MTKADEQGRDDAWEGVVTALSRGMLDGSNMYHFADVGLADGRPMRVRISRRLWKSLAVGDRIAKRSGSEPFRP
ncbi:hypothetical protein ABTX82_33295 [Streptomyces lavendulae]|uniref:DUF7489 domain-containing protein n=1 Tax=Streptomyces lavendulae TaxID=1914 RepID=UPI00331BB82B